MPGHPNKLSQFWHQLKRRGVIRAVAMYAAAAFIVMEAADIMLPRLGMPDWIVTLIIIILIAGSPLVVIFSWIFDITPEGVVRTGDEVSGNEVRNAKAPTRRKLRISDIIIGVLLIAVLLLVYPRVFRESDFRPLGQSMRTAMTFEKSIVVLPFDHLSDMTGLEYFTDGLMEDLLNQLGNIEDLRVISRTTSRQFRGTSKTIPQIATELEVNYVVTGSIRKSGEDIRLVTQLIHGRKDDQLYSQSYDRRMSDIVRLQNDLAIDIATHLKAELLPETRARMEQRLRTDPRAYDYYIRANYAITEYTRENNNLAMDYYRKAIDIDPSFAEAWAGLACGYLGRGREWIDTAEFIMDQALELNRESAHVLAASALIHNRQGRMKMSLEANKAALQVNPNHSMAMGNLGMGYKNLGDYANALKWFLERHSRDPLGYQNAINIAVLFGYFGQPDKSEEWFLKARSINHESPRVFWPHAKMCLSYSRNQQALALRDSMIEHFQDPDWNRLEQLAVISKTVAEFSEAEILFRRAFESNSQVSTDWYAISPLGLGHLLVDRGAEKEGRDYLDMALRNRLDEIEHGNSDHWTMNEISMIYAILGEKEQALFWLEKSVDAGWMDYRYALLDPWFASLHDDPEFMKIMEEISLRLNEMHREFEAMVE